MTSDLFLNSTLLTYFTKTKKGESAVMTTESPYDFKLYLHENGLGIKANASVNYSLELR